MKDFDKYFDFIKDEETKSSVKKILDKCLYIEKNYVAAVTDFNNPYVVQLSLPIFKNYDIKFELFPSFEHSERKVFILYPDYLDEIDKDEYIIGLRIHNKSKFKKLNHKDYLGSLMSLQIERSKIGDIYVYDDFADIVLHKDISKFLIYNIEKIGNNKVELELININDVKYKEQDHEVLVINSSSLRVDGVVKNIINVSREMSSEMVKQGLVKINWQEEYKTSQEIKLNDMISIKKHGRYKVSNLLGLTKSGKNKIEIKHYI